MISRYPPLAVFVYTLLAALSIPLLIFTGTTLTTASAIFGGAAIAAVSAQSLIVMFASTFLLFALAVAALVGGAAAFWFAIGFFALQTYRKAVGEVKME